MSPTVGSVALRVVAGLAALAALTACSAQPVAQPVPAAATASATGAPPAGGHAEHGAHGAHGAAAPGVELWAVQSGPLGVVVTDGEGQLLYRSDLDGNDPSAPRCTGPCAETWLPELAEAGKPPTLLGIDATKVGTVARTDGTRQITLAGWPLYRHVGDAPGLTTQGAQGTDGVWFAVTPTGGKAGS
jgi:predicted lipoprotein with Yx(FWY)xxD motif